jgi:hypothetical protein
MRIFNKKKFEKMSRDALADLPPSPCDISRTPSKYQGLFKVIFLERPTGNIFEYVKCYVCKRACILVQYRWTSSSAVFLSPNSLIHISKIGSNCQIHSQNVSFYLRIQYVHDRGTYLPRITRPTCIVI